MNRYETGNKWEEALGLSLAVVGIAVVWGVALGTVADQPTQHSGTQVYKVVAR
jgi:hypothetical protein